MDDRPIIRKYCATDKESVINLLRLNTPAYFAPEEEQGLLYYLHNHAADFYVVEHSGRLVGCGGFNLTEDGKTAKISWDIIHPDHQGKRLGTALIEFRIQKIKEIPGIEKISVRTSQHVYRFYEKFGLKLTQTSKDFWAPGFDLYQLECDLNAVQPV